MSGRGAVYPELDVVLLCEQVREEPYNKVTMLGAYLGNAIVVQPRPGQTSGFALGSLGVVARFKGGVGEFKAKMEIVSPSGRTVMGGDIGDAVVHAGLPTVFGIAFVPFPIEELGEYQVVIHLDEARYTHRFNVSVADAEATK